MTEPRENLAFFGHGQAVRTLQVAAVTGRLHHAWLIGGPPGVGKATLAYRFARWLLAAGDSIDLSVPAGLPVARRVAADTHADLLTIERRFDEKRKKLQSEIVIDTVHEVGRFLRLTPGEGGWRVVIVDGAEEMNRNAANALLKLLEEPPRKAVLLLVSHAPDRLLPTLRSRCRRLDLRPLHDHEMREAMRHHLPAIAGDRREDLIRLGGGSPGAALTLAAEGGAEIAGWVAEVLAAQPAPERAQAIADQLARSENGFSIFMQLLRGRIAAAASRAAREGVSSLAGRVTLWQEFGRLEREVIGLNLDKRAAVIVALGQFHDAGRTGL